MTRRAKEKFRVGQVVAVLYEVYNGTTGKWEWTESFWKIKKVAPFFEQRKGLFGYWFSSDGGLYPDYYEDKLRSLTPRETGARKGKVKRG